MKTNTDKINIWKEASGGNEIVVISDLHLGEGLDISGNYNGNENFLSR